jgi:hypothetical protein
LQQFCAGCRQAFVINDLRRHPLAWLSIRVLARIFHHENRLVRNDAGRYRC